MRRAAAARRAPHRSTSRGRETETHPDPRRYRVSRSEDDRRRVARGHSVTIFNRGKREKVQPPTSRSSISTAIAIPSCGRRRARRRGKLLHPTRAEGPRAARRAQLGCRDRQLRLVPRIVDASAKLLREEQRSQYIYISSISAYDAASIPAQGGDEDTKLAVLADPASRRWARSSRTTRAQGPVRARRGRRVSGRAAIVRPATSSVPVIPTDRFTYWPMRVAGGGDILAPGAVDDPLQWIDVRDLADWLVTLVEHAPRHVQRARTPAPARWGDVLDACVKTARARSSNGSRRLARAARDGQRGLVPIWNAPTGKYAGFHRWKNERAKAAGSRSARRDTVNAIARGFRRARARVRVSRELEEARRPRRDAKGLPESERAARRADPRARARADREVRAR